MNVASLLNTPRTDAPSTSALTLLRVEAGVIAQALLASARESARESVLAFRFMRGLLLDGGFSAPLK
ncbi:hypothetical protein ATI61_11128 [Archangium gephyra]|uniref:Uncharacterized protein n=1 Tax=Archangium gephyra TaxID=48 RepID=A0AAC8TIB4_9BACT|nr:hypothetical protein [Archangium gephyra]AKJ07063.1 Hypothetical protein AA314_08689 [Archangium gephyra]REG26479.1 hypothetical protein ATI61_11128 [Archangium gephyra]